jgi:ribose transport system permease protein
MSTSTARVEAPGAARHRSLRLSRILERHGLTLLFVAVLAFFTLTQPDTFPSAANVRNILGNQSVLAVAALGAIIPLACGQFDLSLGAVLGLSSIACASVLSHGAALPVGVLAGIGVGVGVGLVNGLIVARVGVNSLVTTLGMATILTGATDGFTNGASITTGIPDSLLNLGSKNVLGVPRVFVAMLLVAIAVWYLLEHTPFGRQLRAIGSNRASARLVGISIQRSTVIAFMLSGALAGAAGVLEVARAGGGNPQVGAGFLLPILAAAFLGATSVRPGTYNVAGTLLAIYFIAASVSGLQLAGADFWIESVVTGAALVVGVALSTVASRHRRGASAADVA